MASQHTICCPFCIIIWSSYTLHVAIMQESTYRTWRNHFDVRCFHHFIAVPGIIKVWYMNDRHRYLFCSSNSIIFWLRSDLRQIKNNINIGRLLSKHFNIRWCDVQNWHGKWGVPKHYLLKMRSSAGAASWGWEIQIVVYSYIIVPLISVEENREQRGPHKRLSSYTCWVFFFFVVIFFSFFFLALGDHSWGS